MIDQENKVGFQLIKGLTDLVNAQTRLQVVMNSGVTHHETKALLKRVLVNISNGVSQFKRSLSEEYQMLFQERILDESVALQIEGMTDMLVDMPEGIRNQIETYIESMHRVYGTKNK